MGCGRFDLFRWVCGEWWMDLLFWICSFHGVVVVGSFNGWVDLGLAGEWWRSWVWVWVMRVVEKERDTEEERGEMEDEREMEGNREIGSFIFILLGSLYYFIGLYIKIRTEMLGVL